VDTLDDGEPQGRGVFRPGKPADSHDVLRVFAIAGRAVNARPDELGEIDQALARAMAKLVPPESVVADECRRLWQIFRTVGASPKPHLRDEAARAYYRDLESLGQRLDLMPLDRWRDLPSSVDEPDSGGAGVPEGTLRWDELVAQARSTVATRKKPVLKRTEVLDLLRALSPEEFLAGLSALVGHGIVDRGEAQLLQRVVKTGVKIGPEDEMLIEIIERLGTYLTRGT